MPAKRKLDGPRGGRLATTAMHMSALSGDSASQAGWLGASFQKQKAGRKMGRKCKQAIDYAMKVVNVWNSNLILTSISALGFLLSDFHLDFCIRLFFPN